MRGNDLLRSWCVIDGAHLSLAGYGAVILAFVHCEWCASGAVSACCWDFGEENVWTDSHRRDVRVHMRISHGARGCGRVLPHVGPCFRGQHPVAVLELHLSAQLSRLVSETRRHRRGCVRVHVSCLAHSNVRCLARAGAELHVDVLQDGHHFLALGGDWSAVRTSFQSFHWHACFG